MKDLLVLSGNKLNAGLMLKKQQYNVDRIVVIDWNRKPDFPGDTHVLCDIKNYECILRYIKKLKIDDIQCVFTSTDIAVWTQAEIHRKFGYFTPSKEAVENALYKNRMIACWRKHNLCNRFSALAGEDDSVALPEKIDKFIIKPNASSGSRGITIINKAEFNEAVFRKARNRALECSMDKKVLIEEYIDGIEYTIEMLGDNFGNVSVWGVSKKYHTIYNRKNKIANKLHYNPNDVSLDELNRIGLFGIQCYKALGLKNSIGHLEVLVTKEGAIEPVEIGARSSGFIASHCVDGINDKCLLNEYSQVIRGKRIENGCVFNKNLSSMYYFYDFTPGVGKLSNINLMNFLDSDIISVAHERERLQKGELFLSIEEDSQRYGYEILTGTRSALRIEKILKAEEEFEKQFMGKADLVN